MIFSDAKIQTVYEAYEARAQSELATMRSLEIKDGLARRDEFLLPVGLDVGRFLHSLILALKPKRIHEVGTSYGYSTLFLADAAKQIDATLVTMELQQDKQNFAKDQMKKAGLDDCVDFQCGDAVELLKTETEPFELVLLDIWKELYVPCFDVVYPNLIPEGVIASDNMIDPPMHIPDARVYREAINSKPDLQTTLLPIGSGIELTCRWPTDSPKL